MGAPVYLAAVLEYLTAETLEVSAQVAQSQKKSRINPRHILLATKEDPELDQLCQNAVVASGGVKPSKKEAGAVKKGQSQGM